VRPAAATCLLALVGTSCNKVPIVDVQAGFALADAAWFAEEQTLFFFYEVSAEQGINEPSVIEITYATDEERVDWTLLSELPMVHTHLDIDCGVGALCGSASLSVPLEPREVDIRLRYHRDGELSLPARTAYNVVGPGAAWSNRSLIIYGVFDETNQRIQWRSRHQFPTVRNEHAEALGLRRDFTVEEQRYGDGEFTSPSNPYGYGAACPIDFEDAGLALLETDERALFNPEALPIEASDVSTVCAQATVTDAIGEFTTGAVARKNPEVRPAFPILRSPIRDATPVEFFLAPCDREISPEHEEMQRQRLQLGDLRAFCIDDWTSETFVGELAEAFTDAVEAERVNGEDMVLVIGLHRDEAGVAEVLEEALALIVPEERHRSSPRLAGAYVFDSDSRAVSDDLTQSTLWCPATLATDFFSAFLPSASERSCPTFPDVFGLDLGPLSFDSLPILPNRSQYLDFIADFSEAQAGEVTDLRFLAPEFTTTSEHYDIGEFGVVTFPNGELISADADDAFSYCISDEPQLFVFRSDLLQDELLLQILEEACEAGEYDEALCESATQGLLPISLLADWHNQLGERSYDIGLFWDFPFLLQMDYELVIAGSVSAFGLSVPFGFGDPAEQDLGTLVWTTDEFSLEEDLTQCDRFCDHPTFDGAGIYHVTDPFRETYANTCYVPTYPLPGGSGFPRDP